jgi:hypothetical protein
MCGSGPSPAPHRQILIAFFVFPVAISSFANARCVSSSVNPSFRRRVRRLLQRGCHLPRPTDGSAATTDPSSPATPQRVHRRLHRLANAPATTVTPPANASPPPSRPFRASTRTSSVSARLPEPALVAFVSATIINLDLAGHSYLTPSTRTRSTRPAGTGSDRQGRMVEEPAPAP